MSVSANAPDHTRDRIASLRLLGTNGFFPSHGRHTMTFLTRTANGGALLLDAGTGVSRLGEDDVIEELRDVVRLDIVLTHYHLDHVAGLPYLVDLWDRPIRLFAPAPPLVDATPDEAFGRLTGQPLFPVKLADFHHHVELLPYDCSEFTIDELTVHARRQLHPGGSVGLRFGDPARPETNLVYATDTCADPETVAFARGAAVLLHEIWVSAEQAEAQPRLVRGHTSDRDALRIAIDAGVGRLVPVHHHPRLDTEQLDEWQMRLGRLLAEIGDERRPQLVRSVDGAVVEV